MSKPNKYFKYKTSRQSDGSYVVLGKDLIKNKVDIHSHHDTLEEAEATVEDLESKPSKLEAMKMINDLRFSMDQIKNNNI